MRALGIWHGGHWYAGETCAVGHFWDTGGVGWSPSAPRTIGWLDAYGAASNYIGTHDGRREHGGWCWLVASGAASTVLAGRLRRRAPLGGWTPTAPPPTTVEHVVEGVRVFGRWLVLRLPYVCPMSALCLPYDCPMTAL